MADIVKDTLDKSARQRKIVFQQKKPLLNYELNLAQDILREGFEEFSRYSIGDNYAGDSFKVYPSALPNEIIIKKGTIYHKGVPVNMSVDVTEDMPLPPGLGSRQDLVYLVWSIEEVDSPMDPAIGFVTSKQNQLIMEIIIEEDTTEPTGIVDETITFSSSGNSIEITEGFFPDWMRIPGTQFRTNSSLNKGFPFYTVNTSPTNKEITVVESIVDEVASDVRFTEYKASLEIVKEFRAFRTNFIPLALVTRTASLNQITVDDISDQRNRFANNFTVNGCAPLQTDLLEVTVSSGEYFIGNDNEFVEADEVLSVPDDTLSYIYINSSGSVVSDTLVPFDFHVMIAEVTAISGEIALLNDQRQYRPISGNSVASGSGSEVTVAGIQSFTAGENINAYDAVYLHSNNIVRKAIANDGTKLPVIGVATQNTLSGQKNTFLTFGIIKNNSWSWSSGEDIFIDVSSGGLTNASGVSAFAVGDYVHRVGVAVSPTEVFIKPDMTYIFKDSVKPKSYVVLKSNGDLEAVGFPYSGEQRFLTLVDTSVFTITEFSFVDSDDLEITVNGLTNFEDDGVDTYDFVKNGMAGTVTFNYSVLEDSVVVIRKM